MSSLSFLTWNIENFKRNKSALSHFTEIHLPDFILLSEPQMFQCDHLLQMRDFQSKYCSSLNSPDVYDPELPLKTSRCNAMVGQ